MADDHVPTWVPEVAPGVHADVYPVENPSTSQNPHPSSPAELRLDREAVTQGYSDRRLPYEFSSCLPPHLSDARPQSHPLPSSLPSELLPPSLSTADLSKLRTGLTALRRSRPTKLQRIELHVYRSADHLDDPTYSTNKAFPLQKPMPSNSLEDWFSRLKPGTNYSLSDLSRTVPLGPAIVRAAGKVIEMMAVRSVPTQRAAWYIRIAVLNECVKQIRPDRPPPSPRAFWTRQLCVLLQTEIDAIRARKTAILGSLERVKFWDYVLDLARWQADESLLDISAWVNRISSILRTELFSSQCFSSPGTKIAVMAARRFLPEFVISSDRGQMLCDALLPGAMSVVKSWRTTTVGRDTSAKNAKVNARKGGKKASFTPNACHAEIALLLAAGLRAMHASIPKEGPDLRLSDLERLVKRAADVVVTSKDSSEGRKRTPGKDKPDAALSKSTDNLRTDAERAVSSNSVVRELEKVPSHGDVGKVAFYIRAAYKEHGGMCAAVKKVCEWAVEGPVSDRAEAICVGSAIIASFADACRSAPPRVKSSRSHAPAKRMKKVVHPPRSPANGTVNTPSTPVLQRELWQFMKDFSNGRDLESLDKDNCIVRFIAQLCRLDQLSLPLFVRDVSRLYSCGHPGSGYLVKCLSLLPDPAEKSISDCRRALLRKFGYVSTAKSNYSHGVEDKVLKAACCGDVTEMEREAHVLVNRGQTNVILSTAEAVRLENIASLGDGCTQIHNKIFTMGSFFLFVDEPGIAVEWVIENLADVVEGAGEWGTNAMVTIRLDIVSVLIRLLEDLSRYVAACGLLDWVFGLLKKAWLSTWISPVIRKRILHTQAALCRLLAAGSGNKSMYWTRMAMKSIRQHNEHSKARSLVPFAVASIRGRENMEAAAGHTLAGVLVTNNRENFGLSADDDVVCLISQEHMHELELPEIRETFSSCEDEFPIDNYFLVGFTANEIFGSVFIPVLAEALIEPTEEDGSFSKLAVAALEIIGTRQNDVRLQGVRPSILLEFISLLIAGCILGHTDTSASLEVLVEMRWVWKVLAPSAGIGLAKKLRSRVDSYCEKIVTCNKEELSAMLFNMVTRFSGESGRDEVMVSNALGSEPIGMIEMQLALLAEHRRESREDEEFGTRISDAAVSLICRDSARTLVSTALRCCQNDDSRQVVGGLMGYAAVQTMIESLEYVVTGLTVESLKNTELHRVRADEWCKADTARRSVLECAIESLSQDAALQVESALFDQLVTATGQLSTALSEGCMPSNLLDDGCRISDALESRLICILRSQRTPHAVEVWRQRCIQVAELIKCAAPLLKSSSIIAASKVLSMCLKHLGEAGKGEDNSPGTVPLQQILDRPNNQEVKKKLDEHLTAAMLWIEAPEREVIAQLAPTQSGSGSKKHEPVKAVKADGKSVDNWILLEGYGRGADEDCAIPPSAFWRQGEGAFEGQEPVAAVQLKRTYSTFASLAV